MDVTIIDTDSSVIDLMTRKLRAAGLKANNHQVTATNAAALLQETIKIIDNIRDDGVEAVLVNMQVRGDGENGIVEYNLAGRIAAMVGEHGLDTRVYAHSHTNATALETMKEDGLAGVVPKLLMGISKREDIREALGFER